MRARLSGSRRRAESFVSNPSSAWPSLVDTPPTGSGERWRKTRPLLLAARAMVSARSGECRESRRMERGGGRRLERQRGELKGSGSEHTPSAAPHAKRPAGWHPRENDTRQPITKLAPECRPQSPAFGSRTAEGGPTRCFPLPSPLPSPTPLKPNHGPSLLQGSGPGDYSESRYSWICSMTASTSRGSSQRPCPRFCLLCSSSPVFRRTTSKRPVTPRSSMPLTRKRSPNAASSCGLSRL